MASRLFLPTDVQFGAGAVHELPQFAKRYGHRAVLITSAGIFADRGPVDRMAELLQSHNLSTLVWDTVQPGATSEECDRIAHAAQSARCDLVIGLGGETVLNIAKAVALVCTNGGEAGDYLIEQDGYRLSIHHPPLPTILIPVGYGTLAEVSPGFTLRDATDKIRKKLSNANLRATAALVDPEYLDLTPRSQIPLTAIWLLSVAMELQFSTEATPLSDALVGRVLENLNLALPALAADPDQADARMNLAQASILAALAASGTSLGPVYALSEAMLSRTTLTRGMTAAALLPSIMEFNLTAAPARFVQVVKNLGEDVRDISVLEAAIRAVERVRLAIEQFHLPTRLSEYGLQKAQVAEIGDLFFRFEEARNNPRPFGDGELQIILEQAL